MKIIKKGNLYAPITSIVNSSMVLVLAGFFCLYLSACTSSKNISYFKDVPDTLAQKKEITQVTYITPVIQPDDILQVSVQTLDPNVGSLSIQQGNSTLPSGSASLNNPASGSGVNGFIVDKQGYVILPLLGKIKAQGKTTDEIRDEIHAKALEFYKDPIVNVRYANFKITVLGEVARPSSYVMPNEKVSLLDALGAAGDLTIYGKRENVLLVRDKNGKKEFARFNLNNSNLFTSPYYYLQQGDLIYVEPNRAKVVSTDAARLRAITIITSAVSLVTIIIARVL